MFKFDFDLGEEELDEDLALQNVEGAASAGKKAQPEATSVSLKIFTEHALDDLLKALPNMISYSPLRIPSPSSTSPSITLAKRDLFDARFQLISSGGVNAPTGSSDAQAPIASNEREEEAENPDLQFVEAPSDLVPGVYEGGLKTWECSVDLAGHLPELVDPPASKTRRLRVLELGCGTAVPSLALLHDIFASEPSVKRNVEVHLQDYNELVFRLVTVPNVILAWYMSPASKPFLSSQLSASQTSLEAVDDQEQEPYPPPDAAEAGDLPLTPALLDAFRASLKDYGITLRFFSGSWETFGLASAGGRYDIILTSETIYRTESLGPLVDLMWRACTGVGSDEKGETVDSLAKTTTEMSLEARHPLCLVAAKLVYFGVGGGVTEFTRAVTNGVPSAARRSKGMVETVWEKEGGVRRVLLKVKWE